MDFLHVPAASYPLGLRETQLPSEAWNALDAWMDRRETVASFSPSRSPNLSAFDIAKVPVPAWDLLKEDEVPDSAYASLPALVDWIDAALGVQGLRLATEDELEAALGPALFPWGPQIPPGTPWPPHTVAEHRPKSALCINTDPYSCELVRTAFKLGDGGVSVCGGYPWPVGWLAFAVGYRVHPDLHTDLVSWMENAQLRVCKSSPTHPTQNT